MNQTGTIVIADDNAFMQTAWTVALAGSCLAVYASGHELLAAAHHGSLDLDKVDAAVLDYKLDPDLDGYQLALALKQLAPDLPIVVISNDPDDLARRYPDWQRDLLALFDKADDVIAKVKALLGRG